MGAAAAGCCAECSTSQPSVTIQPVSGSQEKNACGRSLPSAPPHKDKGADSSGASPRNATEEANRNRANSGGTGETPDYLDFGHSGSSGAGLANRNKLGKEARGRRKSTLSSLKSLNLAELEDEEEPRAADLQNSLQARIWRKSYLDFSNPQQTIIIFDWDDTLFPTTWIQEDMHINAGGNCPKTKEFTDPLKQCATKAAELLKLAATFANQVSVVTLAESPWVEYTCRNFYRTMQPVLASLDIRIIYARDVAAQANSGGTKEEGAYNKQVFQSNEERAAYWTGVKGDAIRMECERFYSQYDQQTWKNVISLGDSDFEKEGTIEVTRQYVLSNKKHGAYQLPRTKTVKFLDAPTADELCSQLRLVKKWLPSIVHHDEGFNLDFETVGDVVEDIGELLKKAHAFEAEPRSEALFDNLFWKKDKSGDPFDQTCWRPRRIWLSKTGRMWYESLKDVKAMELFDGTSVGDLEVAKLQANRDIVATIEGMPVYGLSFKKADAPQADFFLLTQDEDREALLRHINSFKKAHG